MKTCIQIAKHYRELHFGGNWTAVNLKEVLSDVTWQQATTKIGEFNTIAILVYHIHYYTHEVLKVLDGGPLEAKDKYSFNVPSIQSEKNWQDLLDATWTDATKFSNLIEKLPDSKLWEGFSEEKYGNYYRNLHGIIEHGHYHLGQIVLLKKWIQRSGA